MLLGGSVNEAWAKKVTYHILTKPFTVRNYNNSENFRTNIRVEALQCSSEEETVGLPDQFKSPLAKNFRYWAAAPGRTWDKLYDSGHNGIKIINTKYYIYQCGLDKNVANWEYACLSNEITNPAETSSDADGIPNDIYVTYDYDDENGIIDLNGRKSYNLAFTKDGKEKYVCFNRSRNNRIASALGSGLTGDQLASDDFVVPVNDKKQLGWNWSKWGPQGLLLRFKFTGEDPYNITIMTSYEGPELHITDAVTGVDGTGTVKPYAGSTLMSKVNATSMWFDVSNNKHYKISSGITDYTKWTEEKYAACWKAYYVDATTNAERYDTWDGFYRNESPTLNAFAFLNHPTSGYMFVGSKMNQGTGNSPTIYQPDNSGQYYTYYDNYDNDGGGRSQPYFKAQSLSDALSFKFNVVQEYTFHVTTHGSATTLSTTKKWSDAELDERIVDHIPNAFKRKYVTFAAYSDAGLTQPVSTFQDIKNANNGNHIYLKYTSSMPFEALPLDGDYQNARWYTMRMNGDAYDKYLAYDDGSNNLVTTDNSGDTKGSDSDVHQGEADGAVTQVAFMGDPFELRILSRKASEGVGNRYIGCATDATNNTTLNTNKDGSDDISTWEIVDDGGYMVLRKYGSYASPMYIGMGSAANDKPVTYSSTASRIKVVALEKKKYMYHIVRSDGSVAVMASTMQDVGQPLYNYTHIPEIICTPFFNPALGYSPSLSFYYTKESSDPQINAPYVGDGVTEGIYAHVYVRYSFGSTLPSGTYNVRLNGQYIYYNASSSDKSKIDYAAAPVDADEYKWPLEFSDPYAMTINNTKASQYVTVDSWTNGAVLGWGVTGSKFIIKSSYTLGVYEVMAATGEDVDASETYYNIGRNGNEIRLYSNATYSHTYAQLRFLLTPVNSSAVDYHLYDKSGSELLVVRSHSDQLVFPSDYHSPLVDTYYYWTTSARNVTLSSLTAPEIETDGSSVKHVYVTYDTNNLVNLKKGALYLLKFDTGESFRQENGSDDLLADPSTFEGTDEAKKARYQAVYPYCNGDCNFFVYGQEQYEIQQQGAASTRTRWVWYLESANNDPYHVKVCSRQLETFNSVDNQAYFCTYAVKYQQDAADAAPHVVTTLAWPGITGEQGTEYMVLGSAGMYQLVTTETIPIDLNGDHDYEDTNESNERHVVKSFEQYWKTYDTIKNKLITKAKDPEDDTKSLLDDEDKGANPTGATTVVKEKYRTLLTSAPTAGYGFHSYPHWAYAKRFNGYNAAGETKKGWEEIEHWYQTVNMGEGYFNFVKTNIDPALILLDQHGWEIMRKPLPSSPDEDPEVKAAKYAAIRPYDSPMVKEYYFWSGSKKMTGYHQYYNLSGQITVNGKPYTSTSLTSLPPYESTNVKDAKGNLNDQYVTYVVKDEYVKSYTCTYDYDSDTKKYSNIEWTAQPFLIQQGEKYVNASNASTLATESASGGMSQVIISANGSFDNKYLWYVKPNADIDQEMGYGVGNNASTKHSGWNSDYIDNPALTGYPSNGFDPYNIQITNVEHSTKFATNANEALLDDGIITGNGTAIYLGTGASPTYSATKYYDGSELAITNTTFMAVADADGSIQLMPRFDQNKRIRNFSTLESPIGEVDKMNQMKTSLYLPTVYEYHIIDNSGNESLRYKSGGDLTPQIPDHFKSPLAKDFKYYSSQTDSDSDGEYDDEITTSFASATLTNGNVYVRYELNEDADALRIFEGKWLTMQLNAKNAIYNAGIKQASDDKPSPLDDEGTAEQKATKRAWQWKFLETPQSTPDPYAVYLFNRSQSAGTKAIANKFAILSHTSGDYAFAEAGLGTEANYDYTYKFLNGNGLMSTSEAATTAVEPDFTSTAGTFSGTNSQVKLLDDVEHTFTYNIYTNNNIFAIAGEQGHQTIQDNDFKPVVPDNIKSPLLKLDYFRYYNKDNLTFSGDNIATADTTGKALNNLYGLYDDIVCVRYVTYNPDDSPYKVPNVMGQESDHIARGAGSNDAGIGLDGKLLYNIAWYNDQMMKNNVAGTGTESTACGSLSPAWTPTATPAYEWHFDGSDPYAIKIKSVGASDNETSKYIHQDGENATCNLDASATTFMILNKDNYEDGVLAVTGDKTKMLSYGAYDHDNDAGTADIIGAHITTSDPTKFIFYALATHKVIYHLVIAPTATNTENPEEGCYETIPYWNGSEVVAKKIPGSTQRDLTSKKDDDPLKPVGSKYQLGETMSLGGKDVIYCYDAGHISLGDKLSVPSVFYRPNVVYSFIVEGVYSDDACTSAIEAMNTEYKGHEVTNMGDDSGLLNTTVRINIVYSFNGNLDTNAGEGFVTDPAGTQWYTFETSGTTPYLSQFTNAMGGFEVKEGRTTHYTNDFLWSPLGDPYGFRLYNRYVYKNSWNGTSNSGETNRVMTTIDNSSSDSSDGPFKEGKAVTMSPDNSKTPEEDPNNVYELLKGSVDGYFFVHPVANNTGTKYYLKTVEGVGIINMKLSSVPTNLTFGLTEDLVKPYFDLVGYVGGLKEDVATSEDFGTDHVNVKAIATAIKNGTALTGEQLIAAQKLVYTDSNVQPFAAGYYRMHSPDGLEGLNGIRYASGYTHKKELTGGEGDTPIPMHFYEREGTSTQFNLLKSKDGERVNEGFTSSVATRGDIPIPKVEEDPASIFYITGTYDNAKISTQELYVKGEVGRTEDNGSNTATIETEGVRAKAQMTDIEGNSSALWIMDIGGGVMLIHDRSIPKYRKYLSFDQNDAAHIYDLKLTHNTHTDHAKWCLQPANNLGLRIATHSGGDAGSYGGTAYYYSTFYAPFDILLPDDVYDKTDPTKITKQYRAFICDTKISPWNNADLHPRPISWYNIEGNNCPSTYHGSMKFVPAGTPVILAAIDDSESGYIKVTIPTSAPSLNDGNPLLTTGFKVKLNGTDLDAETRNNTLTGQYLEQKLDAGDKGYVYVFGVPYTGTFSESGYGENGDISATLPSPTNSGWGFYKNINPNKEANPVRGYWTRNNWYVLGNKVYYRAAGAGAPAMSPEFVPVVFDDGEQPEDEELQPDGSWMSEGDGCIYDLQGRKVATKEQVTDGKWRERLSPGIYILNGRKFKM